jgi:23S rRNA U2552 (ribose-2'-O)-methylase RlmE/FtsJ
MISVEIPLIRGPIREIDTEMSYDQTSCAAELQEKKACVPRVIAQKGQTSWNNVTYIPLPKVSVKPISRAYYKLKEICESCALPEYTSSLHICEAPGGFVQFINEWCGNKLKTWKALSLEDSSINFNQLLSSYKNGEIMKLSNKSNILLESVRNEINVKVDFVTADGATGETHEFLEKSHYELLIAQTDIALNCLNQGGDFVCKFFEASLIQTKVWISVLTNCFQNVSIIKPVSSKITNSERYIVCRGFITKIELINKCYALKSKWIEDLDIVLDKINKKQIDALNKSILLLS